MTRREAAALDIEGPAAINAIRQGFGISVLKDLERDLELNTDRLADILSLSVRTLYRKGHASGRFDKNQSDRIYRLMRVKHLASEVLETREKANEWLKTPNLVLRGNVPLDLLDTEAGVAEVIDALLSLKYGMYL